MMFTLIAHAGEVHDDVVESSAHLLEAWYVALPLFTLAVAAIGAATYFLTKRSLNNTILVVNTCLLVGGLLLYQFVPTVSAVALSLGFAMSLISVLGGLKLGK